MVWITTQSNSLQRLYNAELMDSPVAFNQNGTAQVEEDVGEALVDHYENINYKE